MRGAPIRQQHPNGMLLPDEAPALARWPPAESTELQDSPVQHGGMAQVVHTWVQMFANFEVEVFKKRYANYIAKYQSKQGSQNIKIP